MVTGTVVVEPGWVVETGTVDDVTGGSVVDVSGAEVVDAFGSEVELDVGSAGPAAHTGRAIEVMAVRTATATLIRRGVIGRPISL